MRKPYSGMVGFGWRELGWLSAKGCASAPNHANVGNRSLFSFCVVFFWFVVDEVGRSREIFIAPIGE
jgi:hypothetical protein